MVINGSTGKIIEIDVSDESFSYEAIQDEGTLTLYFSSDDFIEIPVGAYCDFEGKRYTLEKDENFTKEGEEHYDYTLILYSPGFKASLWKIANPIDGRIKFSYTATPREHLQLIVDCLNIHDNGWTVGECLECEERTVNYNHTYIIDGIVSIADVFKTEYEIDNKKLHLRKVEYNKTNPLAISYKKGFKPGVSREVGDLPPEVILIEGTERNIDFSKYGSKTLLLPKNQTLEYEGQLFKTDAAGTRVMRADKPLTNGKEDSLDCSEIYPSRVGTVSSVIEVDKENNFYDFVDDSIPSTLDFNKYLINNGESITVIFQTGMLSGSEKEFEVKYYHEAVEVDGKIKPGRRFEIVPQEIDGITMPNGSEWMPEKGNKYAVFGVQLPDDYICNNKEKTGASWDMFREAARFLYENGVQTFTYKGTLDGIWSKKRWNQIGEKIKLGGYVLLTDDKFQPEGVLIRIVGIKQFVNNPHKPEIELSNCAVGASITNDLEKITGNEVVIEDKVKGSVRFTKRRFRDALETLKMLQGALLNFSGSINPITVHAMMLLLGDESLQYRFVSNKTNPSTVRHIITYDNKKKILNVPAGTIQHMTLGIKNISSSHKVSEYKFWDVPEFNSLPLYNDKDAFYLYVKVSKTSQTGTFLLSKTAIQMEDFAGFYHLLVGVLNSEYDDERSFVELYGFTEILPGRITTDRIVSVDGQNFIDFINNAVRIGNASTYIDYNTKGDEKIRIKGIIIQSESGTESFIGCYRGIYNNAYTYYPGDEVIYNNGINLSTYRYKYPTPAKGKNPDNEEYWEVVAQGGLGIKETDVLYALSVSNTVAPTNGWQTDAPAWIDGKYIWSKTKVTYTDNSVKYTDAACITGGKGETGNGISSIVEQYYLSSSATSLSSGSWTTTRPTWRDGWYIWTRSVITYTAGNQVTTSAICVTGGKGETGENGDYFEYRYAVNGSRTNPPSLSKTSASPSGWGTAMPSVGALQYLWCTVAKKKPNGTLVTEWSTPVRMTGYDGKDGEVGPALTYQGVYSSSKKYYGTPKRVDAVKYNNIYYVARVDAGSDFYNHAPTDTKYWNEFGNQFENVATNLLLAENAAIGSWYHSGGKIVSTLSDGNKITLDASMAQIIIESSLSGGTQSLDKSQGAIIKLDATNGLIEARSKSNGRVAYMSPTGIFCNNAETQTESAALGVIHKAAVVGLGYGTVNKAEWNNDNFLAGVYGTARNSGNAPAFGGFFQNLMAAGLFLNMHAIEDKYNSKGELITGYTYLNTTDSLVIGYSRNEQIAYLPNDCIIGRIIFFKQWWVGNMKVFARGGQVIYDDHTANSYFRVTEGRLVFAIFTIGYIDNVRKEAWLVNTVRDFIED